MTEGGAGGPAGSPGSAREEAARLLEALAAWAGGAGGGPGSVFAAAREHVASDGIATGSAACRVCPVCSLIAALRGVRPDVVEHLLDAGGSLLAAVRVGLEPPPGHGRTGAAGTGNDEGPPPAGPAGRKPGYGETHRPAPGHGRVERIDIG